MPTNQDTSAMQQALIDHIANATGSSRRTTLLQLTFAAILMLAGAAVGVISVELKDTAVAAGFGTALLGAGATLLPAGASASANSDLHSALAQLALLVGTPQTVTAAPVTTAPAATSESAAVTAPPTTPAPAPVPIVPALPLPDAAGNGAVAEAVVRSAIEADAADAAALRAEQPA
jgi:hypothetical protein